MIYNNFLFTKNQIYLKKQEFDYQIQHRIYKAEKRNKNFSVLKLQNLLYSNIGLKIPVFQKTAVSGSNDYVRFIDQKCYNKNIFSKFKIKNSILPVETFVAIANLDKNSSEKKDIDSPVFELVKTTFFENNASSSSAENSTSTVQRNTFLKKFNKNTFAKERTDLNPVVNNDSYSQATFLKNINPILSKVIKSLEAKWEARLEKRKLMRDLHPMLNIFELIRFKPSYILTSKETNFNEAYKNANIGYKSAENQEYVPQPQKKIDLIYKIPWIWKSSLSNSTENYSLVASMEYKIAIFISRIFQPFPFLSWQNNKNYFFEIFDRKNKVQSTFTIFSQNILSESNFDFLNSSLILKIQRILNSSRNLFYSYKLPLIENSKFQSNLFSLREEAIEQSNFFCLEPTIFSFKTNCQLTSDMVYYGESLLKNQSLYKKLVFQIKNQREITDNIKKKYLFQHRKEVQNFLISWQKIYLETSFNIPKFIYDKTNLFSLKPYKPMHLFFKLLKKRLLEVYKKTINKNLVSKKFQKQKTVLFNPLQKIYLEKTREIFPNFLKQHRLDFLQNQFLQSKHFYYISVFFDLVKFLISEIAIYNKVKGKNPFNLLVFFNAKNIKLFSKEIKWNSYQFMHKNLLFFLENKTWSNNGENFLVFNSKNLLKNNRLYEITTILFEQQQRKNKFFEKNGEINNSFYSQNYCYSTFLYGLCVGNYFKSKKNRNIKISNIYDIDTQTIKKEGHAYLYNKSWGEFDPTPLNRRVFSFLPKMDNSAKSFLNLFIKIRKRNIFLSKSYDQKNKRLTFNSKPIIPLKKSFLLSKQFRFQNSYVTTFGLEEWLNNKVFFEKKTRNTLEKKANFLNDSFIEQIMNSSSYKKKTTDISFFNFQRQTIAQQFFFPFTFNIYYSIFESFLKQNKKFTFFNFLALKILQTEEFVYNRIDKNFYKTLFPKLLIYKNIAKQQISKPPTTIKQLSVSAGQQLNSYDKLNLMHNNNNEVLSNKNLIVENYTESDNYFYNLYIDEDLNVMETLKLFEAYKYLKQQFLLVELTANRDKTGIPYKNAQNSYLKYDKKTVIFSKKQRFSPFTVLYEIKGDFYKTSVSLDLFFTESQSLLKPFLYKKAKIGLMALYSKLFSGSSFFKQKENTINTYLNNYTVVGNTSLFQKRKEFLITHTLLNYKKTFISFANSYATNNIELDINNLENEIDSKLIFSSLNNKSPFTVILSKLKGFDFLGFCIYQKYLNKKDATFSQKKSNHLFLYVSYLIPSEQNIRDHLQQIKQIIVHSYAKTQDYLIFRLSPIIRGWCEHYKIISYKKIFGYCDYLTFKMLWRWCCRRHPKKNKKWIKAKYFHLLNGKNWVFGIFQKSNSSFICLPNHSFSSI